MKDVKKKVKVSELIINEELTKLRPINIFTVNVYRQNYRCGADFPPIIINKETGLIVSGNHRCKAIHSEFDQDYKVPVIYRSYDSDREMIEDFAKENIHHGNPLTSISKKLIMCKLLDLGATNQEIASLFDIPIKRIEKHGESFKVVTGGKKGCETKRELVPVKRGPVIESDMTPEQYEMHKEGDIGVTFEAMADQIIRWCKNGWIEKNAENMDLANSLIDHLSEYVEKIKSLG